jgi:hypothetical protein
MAVRLSALRAGRFLPPRAIVRLEGLKKSTLSGTWTGDFPVCSIVLQPTTLPRAPQLRRHLYRRSDNPNRTHERFPRWSKANCSPCKLYAVNHSQRGFIITWLLTKIAFIATRDCERREFRKNSPVEYSLICKFVWRNADRLQVTSLSFGSEDIIKRHIS